MCPFRTSQRIFIDFSSVKAVSAQPQISSLAVKISLDFLSISSQAVCFPISISPFLYMISGCCPRCPFFPIRQFSKFNFLSCSEFLYESQPVINNYTIASVNAQPFSYFVPKVNVSFRMFANFPSIYFGFLSFPCRTYFLF